MVTKPTSLASTIAQNAAKDVLANAKEDARTAQLDTEDGKVWVRLQNAHYSSDGHYYDAGSLALLDAEQLPKTAKVLTKRQAEEAVQEE